MIRMVCMFALVVFMSFQYIGVQHEQEEMSTYSSIDMTDVLDEQPLIEEWDNVSQREPRGKWVRAKITAYCPCSICCGQQSDGITSTGKDVYSGNPDDAYGIAADPRAIPYGTKVYVKDYWESLNDNANFKPTRMSEVDDTGGAMRQSWKKGILHLDVRYRTHEAALKWGVRELWIFVYGNGE